jgi:hypothetical protein
MKKRINKYGSGAQLDISNIEKLKLSNKISEKANLEIGKKRCLTYYRICFGETRRYNGNVRLCSWWRNTNSNSELCHVLLEN